jgi:hypothetical protein
MALLITQHAVSEPGEESANCSRLFQEVGRFHSQRTREPVNDVDTGTVYAPFERADISAIDFRAISQLLLRHPPGVPQSPQIERKYFPYLHEREHSDLMSI